MFCNQCGNQLKEGAKFCHQCGAPTPAPIPQPQAPAYPPVHPGFSPGYPPQPPVMPGWAAYAYPMFVMPAPHENWQPAAPNGKKGSWIAPVSIMAALSFVGIALFFAI